MLTGHNIGQLGGRGDTRSSILYTSIVRLLTSTETATVQLTFAPPDLLRRAHRPGYKDLIERFLPRMWDLAKDPQLANYKDRLKINTHPGAMFMSAFVRDPGNRDRALMITTPRWVTDATGRNRMFIAIWKKERPELFEALWGEMESSLETYQGKGLFEVVSDLAHEDQLGQEYLDFVEHRSVNWRLTE